MIVSAGAALTVPSALHMIVHMFPDPSSQSKAVGIFTALGGLGNSALHFSYAYDKHLIGSLIVFGLVIGALFVSFATWQWIFYFIAIVAITEAILVYCLCFQVHRPKTSPVEQIRRLKRLDIFGVACFTGISFPDD